MSLLVSRTARQALRDAVVQLRAAGLTAADAQLDADVLLRHVLGWDRATLLLRRDDPVAPDDDSGFDVLVARRTAREPVAYIVGRREFYGRDFHVTRAVLIPRPETELIVDAVLQLTAPDAVLHMADVCTGSGILAITLACERPAGRVVATDISPAALTVARQNANVHGVTSRVAFAAGDLLDAASGSFDVIVANPPYVPERDAPTLAPDVRAFEPAIALFGGEDGLAIVQRLVAQAAARLVPGGMFVMEFGAGQQYDVAHHATSAGFEILQIVHDLQDIPRVVVCRLRADR